ncbi:hypothetical protein F2Q68_00014688 [Brassica cretica]|uniref:Uncharacterized protein n=1 Tax=Brassica cretica TaxID=69181 RepID=A0A8S9HIQ9_BRACR|nr:hypothetical protein F2Q68_00014688 [Brassica cretica]
MAAANIVTRFLSTAQSSRLPSIQSPSQRAKQFPSSSAISALISKDSISAKKRSIGFGVSKCASFYAPPLINQLFGTCVVAELQKLDKDYSESLRCLVQPRQGIVAVESVIPPIVGIFVFPIFPTP